jgi:organic hydroperoxide reductase OsmC/OhrA
MMDMNADHSGQFQVVTLRPRLTITDAGRAPELGAIHQRAQDLCFIARSVNFPVRCEPFPVISA